VNKKKQKNFIMLGQGRWRRHSPWPGITKVFAPLFSKSGYFLFMPPHAGTVAGIARHNKSFCAAFFKKRLLSFHAPTRRYRRRHRIV
jgi:hypothetical protein